MSEKDHFADRLSGYWKAASVAMSQGGNHAIVVDEMFVDDLRACEAMVRAFPGTGEQGSGA
jgi:hypothetical protein